MIHSVVVYCHVTVNLQEGVTALHLASQGGHVTTVQLLVEAGASLDVQRNVSCYPDTPHLIVWVGCLHSDITIQDHVHHC